MIIRPDIREPARDLVLARILADAAQARSHRVICPAASAASSSGRLPSRRISLTAARASFLVS
jgi:hypothetical protein